MLKLLIFCILLFNSLISTQAQTSENTDRIPFDPKVLTGVLPNGMKYIIRRNTIPEKRADFFIVHRAGSILEDDNQNGLAHFIEHLAFNGTKNFPGKGILNFLERNGVAFGHNINASTSSDYMVYKLSEIPVVREGLIDSSLLILHDWAGFISFNPREIEAERGVIREEWRTRRDADFRLRAKMSHAVFNYSKYAERDVIGDIKIIDSCRYENLIAFYNDWYRPDLQCLIVVGDIDPQSVEMKIKQIFTDLPKRENAKLRYQIEIPDNEEPLISVVSDPEAQNTVVQIFNRHQFEKKRI